MTTVFTLTLSGSALALLLLALRYLILKKMPSTVYYYAWLLVLLRFALPLPGFVPALFGGTEPASAPAPAAYSVPAVQDTRGTGTDLSPRLPSGLPVQEAGGITEQDADSALTEQSGAAEPAGRQSGTFHWRSPALWLTVWAAGAVVCFGYTVASYLRFTRKLGQNLQEADPSARGVYEDIPGRKPKLYGCRYLKTPLMCGLMHPRIILPVRDYDEELLTNILRHELTHYRRGDTLYKWVSVAVLSLHWFNPIAWLARREINRACELSCDEMLLRSMTRAEKQSYGNTLLNMVASSALPAGVVATSFSTEKKNLKERLEQIMHYRKSRTRILAAVLTLVLLLACGVTAGPAGAGIRAAAYGDRAEVVMTDETENRDVIRVSTVDEFLDAIGPNRVIELAAGTYDLSTAEGYGGTTESPYYVWNRVFEEDRSVQAELVLQNLENLTIRGAGMGETVIAAVPRYANVMKFSGCEGVTVSDLTAGHTQEPGFCSGGVLLFDVCRDIMVDACGLYGCGTVGVQARDCIGLMVRGSDIYECSYSAVEVRSCREVLVEDCDIRDHGVKAGQGSAMSLLSASYSEGFTVYRSRIHDNNVQYILNCDYTKGVSFLSNDVSGNAVAAYVFGFQQYGATVDGCSFTDNSMHEGSWYLGTGIFANDKDGNLLDGNALASMTPELLDLSAFAEPTAAAPAMAVESGATVPVKTVDEFLSAIGPDRTIVLDGEVFDLSTAADYGSVGGEYYFWHQSNDGPELVIHDVSGLTVAGKAEAPEAVTLAAIPRYANVLNLRDCENVTLIGFTAGHTKEPGACSGGVLNLQSCNNITLDSMRLYGCGILGIQSSYGSGLSVLRTEIYECSQGAGQFFQTDGIRFVECDVHDVPSPAFRFTQCGDKTWNGEPVTGWESEYDVGADGTLVPFVYEAETEEREFLGSVEDLVNPFADEPTHHYQAGFPQAVFAAAVQQAIADGDWEALADQLSYPLPVFAKGRGFTIPSREQFLILSMDEEFMNTTFSEAFRTTVAQADLAEFGDCVFGETFCDHRIAFSCYGTQVTEENLFVTCISADGPLWPGRSSGYVQTVPPTPEP